MNTHHRWWKLFHFPQQTRRTSEPSPARTQSITLNPTKLIARISFSLIYKPDRLSLPFPIPSEGNMQSLIPVMKFKNVHDVLDPPPPWAIPLTAHRGGRKTMLIYNGDGFVLLTHFDPGVNQRHNGPCCKQANRRNVRCLDSMALTSSRSQA